MQCPKCESTDVTVTLENTKSTTQKKENAAARKAVHGVVRGTAALMTLGISNAFIPKHLNGTQKTKNKLEKFCLCQDCGYSWKIR